MSKTRVVFMGTPDFAVSCLEMIIAEKYEVAAVVTQPDRPRGRGQKLQPSPVKEVALTHHIPVLQPQKIKEANFINELTDLRPDIIIVVAFGQFLPKSILELPPLGCINVHASLLPKYRGAAPIHWAVLNGENSTGVTTMFMDIGMDTGDMIIKKEIHIEKNDNTGKIHDQLKTLGADALKETLSLLVSQNAPRVKQDHTQATYASLLTKEMERINWQASAKSIHNHVRGFNPWPGAFCLHRGRLLKVWQTRVIDDHTTYTHPGRIKSIDQEKITIETGEGLLEILEVQPESKRRICIRDYISGYELSNGELLE